MSDIFFLFATFYLPRYPGLSGLDTNSAIREKCFLHASITNLSRPINLPALSIFRHSLELQHVTVPLWRHGPRINCNKYNGLRRESVTSIYANRVVRYSLRNYQSWISRATGSSSRKLEDLPCFYIGSRLGILFLTVLSRLQLYSFRSLKINVSRARCHVDSIIDATG